jgi:hypothetical protein
MKHLRKSLLSLVLVIPFVFSSCSNDAPSVTAVNSKVYDLGTVGTAGVSGKATFIENSDATEYRIRITQYSEDLILRTST